MNERIRELVRQAVIAVDNPFPGNPLNDELEKMYIPDCFSEKFAELIVRDCLGVLKRRFMGDLNREDMEVKRCIEDVKEHFGVEK